jgi:hypothetical protein
VIHEDYAAKTSRVFDASGNLSFERVRTDTSTRATGWSAAGVRLAEYSCDKDGNLTEARFFDDRGTLARRWNESTSTLADARGAAIAIAPDAKFQLSGTRSACNGALWMLEGPPPGRDLAFKP